ncbi:MAG: RNA chaperone Hfq [Bacillota bacterium]
MATKYENQNAFFDDLIKNETPVTIYLNNGFKMEGTLEGYDSFSIFFKNEGLTKLVFKHAISTLSPEVE